MIITTTKRWFKCSLEITLVYHSCSRFAIKGRGLESHIETPLGGGDPGFSFSGWGGGRKRLCARTHITSADPNSLSAGVQGALKGPGSYRVVLMLSRRAIWALSILIKYLDKTNIVDPIVVGLRPPPPSPWIRHWPHIQTCGVMIISYDDQVRNYKK